jgi:hypothetical protein
MFIHFIRQKPITKARIFIKKSIYCTYDFIKFLIKSFLESNLYLNNYDFSIFEKTSIFEKKINIKFKKSTPLLEKFNSYLYNYIINNKNIEFKPTNIVKYINNNTISNIIILYLRKNKVFNKSRYSRNRQTYRTGFYICILINNILIIGLYYLFYKFSINIGYF